MRVKAAVRAVRVVTETKTTLLTGPAMVATETKTRVLTGAGGWGSMTPTR
jgi:hypothetical protein